MKTKLLIGIAIVAFSASYTCVLAEESEPVKTEIHECAEEHEHSSEHGSTGKHCAHGEHGKFHDTGKNGEHDKSHAKHIEDHREHVENDTESEQP